MRGYKEEGTTTTPFDMVMLNDLDRFHLVMDVIDRVPGLAAGRRGLRQEMVERAAARRAPTRASTARTTRDPRLDLAVLSVGVLVVNAGSTSLKLTSSRTTSSRVAVDGFERGRRGRAPRRPRRHAVRRAGADRRRGRARRSRSSPLAPLHNAPALRAIEARAALPDVPHVAVFDTAFHATIPQEASTYAIPRRWREMGSRRYGFHGLSVAVGRRAGRAARLVVCHLGGGCSVTAVLDGRSVDTTMGFTPLEGVPMATRSGSVDPGALLYLLRERGLRVDELDAALEHESGLRGPRRTRSTSWASGSLRPPDRRRSPPWRWRSADSTRSRSPAGSARTGLVRDGDAERVRFLGDFEVEVVASREELVIAHAVRALVLQRD